MNERFKQLLEQVGGHGTQALMHPDDVEKFAALIVKECLLYTNPSPHEGTDFGRGLGWAHQNIKEHFGVEE